MQSQNIANSIIFAEICAAPPAFFNISSKAPFKAWVKTVEEDERITQVFSISGTKGEFVYTCSEDPLLENLKQYAGAKLRIVFVVSNSGMKFSSTLCVHSNPTMDLDTLSPDFGEWYSNLSGNNNDASNVDESKENTRSGDETENPDCKGTCGRDGKPYCEKCFNAVEDFSNQDNTPDDKLSSSEGS